MRTILLLAVFTGACTGIVESAGGAGGPDAATGGPHPTVDAAPGTNPDPDAGMGMPTTDAMTAAFACRNPVAPAPANGHHNAGQDCQQGCHNHGFTFSGTLYTSAAGAAILAGATITATDAAGKVVDVVSNTNGNFYSSTPVTFPLTMHVSSCPTIQQMSATVTAADGGCNKTGCHVAGGSPGRVHLP